MRKITFLLLSILIITLSSCSSNYETGDIVIEDGVKYQFIDPEIENGYMENIPDYNEETNLAYHRSYPIDMLNEPSTYEIDEMYRSAGDSSQVPTFTLQNYQFGPHFYANENSGTYKTIGHDFELYILDYFTKIDLGFTKPGFYVMGLEDESLNSIRIPLTIKNYPVLGIGEHAFLLNKDLEICIEDREQRRFNIMPYAFSKTENTNPTLKITGESGIDKDSMGDYKYCHTMIFPLAFENLNLILEKQIYCCLDLAFYNCNILKLEGKYECIQCCGFYQHPYAMYHEFNSPYLTNYNMFYYPLGHPILNPIFYNTKIKELDCRGLEHYTNDENIYFKCYTFHSPLPYLEHWYNESVSRLSKKSEILMSNFPTENIYISYYYLLNYIEIDDTYNYNYLKTFVGNVDLYKNAKNIVITSPDELKIIDNKVYLSQDWYIELGNFHGLDTPIIMDDDGLINKYFYTGFNLMKPIEILVIPNTYNAKVTIVDGLDHDDGYYANIN